MQLMKETGGLLAILWDPGILLQGLMHASVCVCMYFLHVHMSAWKIQRARENVCPSVCLSKSEYLTKLGATNPAKLSGHWAPVICLFLSLSAGIKVHIPCLAFYVGARGPDSGPHASSEPGHESGV